MRLKFFFNVIICLFLFIGCKEKSTNIPAIPSYIPANTSQNVVVDLAYLFSKSQRNLLASKIIAYEKETSNEVGILTIDSLTVGIDIQRFGTEVANTWGIGKREKNNGLLITISKYNRKISISTGLGTEKTISDYECRVIIDSIMSPGFKTKNYYEGTNKALDSLFTLWD